MASVTGELERGLAERKHVRLCARIDDDGVPAREKGGDVRRPSDPLPPPWEREGNQDDHDEPTHRHPPPCGIESHEVGAAARFRPEVVPAPPAVVGAFDLIFTVLTGEMTLFGDPSIPGSALRGSLRARHEDSSF